MFCSFGAFIHIFEIINIINFLETNENFSNQNEHIYILSFQLFLFFLFILSFRLLNKCQNLCSAPLQFNFLIVSCFWTFKDSNCLVYCSETWTWLFLNWNVKLWPRHVKKQQQQQKSLVEVKHLQLRGYFRPAENSRNTTNNLIRDSLHPPPPHPVLLLFLHPSALQLSDANEADIWRGGVSAAGPPKDSDCMTNHVQHRSASPPTPPPGLHHSPRRQLH